MATDTASPQTAERPPDERVRRVGRLGRLLSRPELGAVVGAALVWLFFAVVAFDNNFVSLQSTASILNTAAPLGILAAAVTLLMISGEFDLSIGSIVGFSGMAILLLTTSPEVGGLGWALWPAVLVALLASLAVGLFNGALVMATRLPSFIVTLGTLFIFRGLTVAVTRSMTNRTQLGDLDESAGFAFADTLFNTQIRIGTGRFSIAIVWWIALVALTAWLLLRTRSGNWIFGAGGDPQAARNVGVPVGRVKVALFATTAFAAFLVALIQAVQFTGADTLRGTGLEFEAIIAAVVGGTLLTGGYGSPVGAAFGAFIFALVQQGIRITGVDGDWYLVFVGGVLVVAVIFNNFIRRKAMQR